MKTVTFKVNDMSCDGCVNAVRAALTGVDDVQEADVSLESKRARIVCADALAIADLMAAVRDAGYTPELEG